jgi:hypothetical protein
MRIKLAKAMSFAENVVADCHEFMTELSGKSRSSSPDST